jgi:hypothetical protein
MSAWFPFPLSYYLSLFVPFHFLSRVSKGWLISVFWFACFSLFLSRLFIVGGGKARALRAFLYGKTALRGVFLFIVVVRP